VGVPFKNPTLAKVTEARHVNVFSAGSVHGKPHASKGEFDALERSDNIMIRKDNSATIFSIASKNRHCEVVKELFFSKVAQTSRW